jgi:hypothetical protein
MEKAEKYWKEFKLKLKTDPNFHPYFEYGVKNKSIRKKDFIKRYVDFSTHAIVKDGEWIEKGQMGWWGISSGDMKPEEWCDLFDKAIEEASDDTLFTIVDCHI